MTHYDDEFYRDILAGLAVLRDDAWPADILATLTRHQQPRLGAALNANQMASKRWLADMLATHAGTTFDGVVILGGWVGALAGVLLRDARFDIRRVVSVDIDPACEEIARGFTERRGGVVDVVVDERSDDGADRT